MVAEHPELIDLNFRLSEAAGLEDPWDWIHSNGIDYNPELDQIMLSPRNFSEVWIIDHSTTPGRGGRAPAAEIVARGGDLLYRWGNPARLFAQGRPMTSNSSGRIILIGSPRAGPGPETSSFSTMVWSSRISRAGYSSVD